MLVRVAWRVDTCAHTYTHTRTHTQIHFPDETAGSVYTTSEFSFDKLSKCDKLC